MKCYLEISKLLENLTFINGIRDWRVNFLTKILSKLSRSSNIVYCMVNYFAAVIYLFSIVDAFPNMTV